MSIASKITVQCSVCNTSEMTLFGCYSDRRKGLTGSWDIVECSNCGVLMLDPSPSAAQLSEYYSVYSKNKHINFSLGLGAKYPLLRKAFHWLSGDIDPRDFIQVAVGSRVLDYGCGQAGCLIDFDAQGIKISGAEIDADVVAACQKQGIDVRQVENIDQIPFENDIFDVVYLMQVFEHLRNPHGFMAELARVLKNDGVLYLAVPNFDSIWRKVFAKNWVSGWFAPFHLFHYNRDSLTTLANQHGFDVIESWSRTPESWLRLNLKAIFYPKENQLDWHTSWLDQRVIRYLLMCMLRIIELPFRERDCLVIKLIKRETK